MFVFDRIKNKVDRKEYLEFYTIEQARAWAESYYIKRPNEEITTEIEGYCGYVFNPINAALRNEDLSWYGRETQVVKEKYLDKARIITEWITSFKLTNNIIVYRAIDKEHLEKMKRWAKEKRINDRNILYEAGFLSTSLVLSELKKLYPNSIYLKIYVPKGSVGAYIEFIS